MKKCVVINESGSIDMKAWDAITTKAQEGKVFVVSPRRDLVQMFARLEGISWQRIERLMFPHGFQGIYGRKIVVIAPNLLDRETRRALVEALEDGRIKVVFYDLDAKLKAKENTF